MSGLTRDGMIAEPLSLLFSHLFEVENNDGLVRYPKLARHPSGGVVWYNLTYQITN